MDETPHSPVLRREEQPSVACPHCAAHTAQVKSVSAGRGEEGIVNITMFCKDCKETWIVQRATYHDATEPPQ